MFDFYNFICSQHVKHFIEYLIVYKLPENWLYESTKVEKILAFLFQKHTGISRITEPILSLFILI